MVFWRWIGYNTIIYLAGIQSIPKELYEAATIDGASKIQQFRYITIPMLKPFIILTVFTSTVGALQLFSEPTVVFIGLLLSLFRLHMKINWFGSFDDNVNFFYPIFILCIGFVGLFVKM